MRCPRMSARCLTMHQEILPPLELCIIALVNNFKSHKFLFELSKAFTGITVQYSSNIVVMHILNGFR